MSNDFPAFSKIIHTKWETMKSKKLFLVDLDKDHLWNIYLSSFPDGSNPIYCERTEHDCSCCKHFIKNMSNIVYIENGELQSVWNVENLSYPYDLVAGTLNNAVTNAAIKNAYASHYSTYGAEVTLQHIESENIKRWYHFYGKVPSTYVRNNCDSFWGNNETTHDIFKRGLEELTLNACETVLELISQDQLYRGNEHKTPVREFYNLLKKYISFNSDSARNIFIWENIHSKNARFRNTVIGTLVKDLSESPELLEDTVRMFESKVAPQNYKRSKSLITEKMIKTAIEKLNELGLSNAIHRRHANITDISVNDILWVDRTVQSEMKDSLTELLIPEAVKIIPTNKLKNASEIKIENFITEILPNASSIQMMVENVHSNNFMCLSAPNKDNEEKLFKWDNSFGWSYDGNVTDSIQERVKAAGGRVKGAKFRVSLAWFNYDDLDIHMREPNGNTIGFNNKCNKLDVDMNVGSGSSREAVENISFMDKPKDGIYIVYVNQYSKRENIDCGFTLQIESSNRITEYSYEKPVIGKIKTLLITISKGVITKIVNHKNMKGGGELTIQKWGINTHSLIPVQTIMYSPNHWDNSTKSGNKHIFFMLEGMKNPDSIRGIYNEFLRKDLHDHRKVFEILGEKTKVSVTDDQLCGIGFSDTIRAEAKVLVQIGSKLTPYKITF